MKILSLIALMGLAATSALTAAPAVPSPVPAAELPTADHLVFLNELPESADLMADAAANGLTVARLDRTSDRVVITYQYPDGSISTMGYALLSSVRNRDSVTPRRVVQESVPDPEIIYVERPYGERVVYRERYDDFWLPLTLGLGLGWATSYHGHSGWHGHAHGSWHH